MYKYEVILAALQAKTEVKTEPQPAPKCPINSPICKKNVGVCQKGNAGNCEQILKVWYEPKRLRILYPRFVHPEGSTNGYFFEYDKGIAFLVEKGILTQADLQTF